MIFSKTKAFTLIELLVGITILIMIVLSVLNIDINRLNQKQKIDIFANSIKAHFEITRNSSLAGRGIGTTLEIPEQWKIEYSKKINGTSSGTIISSTTFDGTTWTPEDSIIFEEGYYMSGIKCGKLKDDISAYKTLEDSYSGSIIFEKGNISIEWNGLSNCTTETDKIVELEIKYKNDTKYITINSLNGLIETK